MLCDVVSRRTGLYNFHYSSWRSGWIPSINSGRFRGSNSSLFSKKFGEELLGMYRLGPLTVADLQVHPQRLKKALKQFVPKRMCFKGPSRVEWFNFTISSATLLALAELMVQLRWLSCRISCSKFSKEICCLETILKGRISGIVTQGLTLTRRFPTISYALVPAGAKVAYSSL